jgi:hypothetical protein
VRLSFTVELALSAMTGLSVLGVAPVLKRLFRKTTLDDITPEWLESFSVERYRPMLSLLSNDDFDFLSSQPGFDASIYKKLRRERLAIFDEYFRRLISDFKKLHTTARYLVARESEDHSSEAMKLVELRFAFMTAVFAVHFRYLLCKAGVGTMEAQILFKRLQEMNDHLGHLHLPQTA